MNLNSAFPVLQRRACNFSPRDQSKDPDLMAALFQCMQQVLVDVMGQVIRGIPRDKMDDSQCATPLLYLDKMSLYNRSVRSPMISSV